MNKEKAGLLAQLRRAVELSHQGSMQGPVELSYVACYRGQLVAKVMGRGGCTGYYWRWHEFRAECEEDYFWATSFEDAFKDIDEMIDICSRNRRRNRARCKARDDADSTFEPYNPREDSGQI